MAFKKIRFIFARFLVKTFLRIKNYIKRLLFPLYLFPIKIVTYTIYYFLRLLIKIIIWPFRKWSNFFKTIAGSFLILYILFSLLVILDYLRENYGHFSKFLCGYGLKQTLKKSVVRVVGGYSEGSGFFISPNQIITNFHVIADEPSPKIIFSDGSFVTPIKIVGDRDADLAILNAKESYPDRVLGFMEPLRLFEDEPLIAAGYALGTMLKGEVTLAEGRFVSFRISKKSPVGYIQADINLVEGMSGGPLLDKCGQLVGVNVMGLSGLSLFISAADVRVLSSGFTDADIAKITVEATTPEGAVEAFYTYLKARRMEDGFDLLSSEYLKKTNFAEWTNRFKDILDVQIYETRLEDARRNIVFVKFSTKNWVDEEVEEHFYEGTWQTVFEDGVYKMNKSNIKEVIDPDWSWFYELE